MVDDVAELLSSLRSRPVWTSVPGAVRESFLQGLPRDGAPMAAVYEEFTRTILPYALGNVHPRFWGWVLGSGAPAGIIADFLASAMNNNVAGYDQAAQFVEMQIVRWFAGLIGFPATASGLLVSSGSQANFVALAVARTAKAGFNIRAAGVAVGPSLAFYCSEETHQCMQKAIETLGHGTAALRRVPTDESFRIDIAALEYTVMEDRDRGVRPVCVIGNAGTVATGAIDDLAALAALCRRHDLWFHVDGAIGAVTVLSPRLAPLVTGIALADSVAFDMHKWLYLPYDIAAVLVRDEAAHRAAFELVPSYLAPAGRGVAPEVLMFAQLGVDLSRGFRALKAWMALKTYGADRYAEMIEQNVAQAAYLAERVDAHPELERLAPVAMNIACFRYVAPGMHEDALTALNQSILVALQERGIAVVSGVTIRGRFALRAAIVNHRSRREDFDILVEAVVTIGREHLKG